MKYYDAFTRLHHKLGGVPIQAETVEEAILAAKDYYGKLAAYVKEIGG